MARIELRNSIKQNAPFGNVKKKIVSNQKGISILSKINLKQKKNTKRHKGA